MDSTLSFVLVAGGAAGALAIAASALLASEARQRDQAQHVRNVVQGEITSNQPQSPRNRGGLLFDLVRRFGETVQGGIRFSEASIKDLERAAQAAGLNPQKTVPAVIGGKVLLMVACPLLGYAFSMLLGYGLVPRLVFGAAGAVLGMLGPEWVLRYIRGKHAAALERGLPDALDLLVVCAEAGLGMDSAIDRVATEMRAFNPPVALEFATLGQEMRLSSDRRGAMVRMGERTGLESFQRLMGTLSQALHYGTPLGQALRVLSAEMRDHRMLRMEEKAAKLPSLLTLPMILFIFPCQFIVLAGPAAIRILNTFGH